MPNHLKSPLPVLIVGTGAMADAYAAVLNALEQPFVAVGRGRERSLAFASKWQVHAGHGELLSQWEALPQKPHTAIVAVSVTSLAQTSEFLMRQGIKRLLIEKPAGLSLAEVEQLEATAQELGVEAYVAYNRRFYGATEAARRIIAEDGGVLSMKFDFTEASKRLEAMNKPADELAGWFYANSTHVIDLAFFLGGEPVELHAASTGRLPWHPAGAIFTGMGKMQGGAVFSYHANWISTGRWGLEVMTPQRRLVLQPMEQLSYQDHSSFSLHSIELTDDKDSRFKPGLYHQTAVFLAAKKDKRLLSICKHKDLFTIYRHILNGQSFNKTIRS